MTSRDGVNDSVVSLGTLCDQGESDHVSRH
jgi:hypothetical protein